MATYEMRGVSPHKPDVHKAIKKINQGLFPGSFWKAIPDIFSNSQENCVLLHADGVGTKSALAFIHFQKHKDLEVYMNLAQDSLVMNLDDLLCVGAIGPFAFSNTIGRNAKLITGDIVEAIISGYERIADLLRPYGIEIYGCGGETADIGDLVRTVIIDSVLVTRLRKEEFIDCSLVTIGHDIVGFASYGKAVYEPSYNSGIGTNGFTVVRHELFKRSYREEFPETFDPDLGDLAYSGELDIDDVLPGTRMTIGEALLSPTRTYSPILKVILPKYRRDISAIFHNSGGGQTKCLGFGDNIRYIKDNLFPLPPIFEFIKQKSQLTQHEMFRVFNMGHRLEIVCNHQISSEIIDVASQFGVEARIIGKTEFQNGATSLVISTSEGEIEYNNPLFNENR